MSAVRRVAVAQRHATLGGRQNANGQHRVRRPAGGRRAVDRPPVPAAAAVRVGQHHGGGAQGHTAAGVRHRARVEDVQDGRRHLDRHVPDRGAGRDRRGPAGRRGGVAVLRLQPGRQQRGGGARPHTRHGPVRGRGPVQAGRGGAARPDRPLLRQPERDQPERVQEEDLRHAVQARRRAGAHHHIDQQRQGDGGEDPVRGARPGRHALRRLDGADRALADDRPAERGRPVRVRGRDVRQHIRLHAVAQVRLRTLLPVRARRRRVLQKPGQLQLMSRTVRRHGRRAYHTLAPRPCPSAPTTFLPGSISTMSASSHLLVASWLVQKKKKKLLFFFLENINYYHTGYRETNAK